MRLTPNQFLVGSFLLPLWGVCLVFYAAFLHRLRHRHADMWEALGRPKFFAPRFTLAQAARGREVGNFLRSGDDRQLGDSALSLYASVCRILGLVVILLIVLCFLV